MENTMAKSAEHPQTAEEALQVIIWSPELEDSNTETKKRRYGKIEGEKVAANRGYACDDHRRRKVKVKS
jgi:hypothetical protein